MTDITHTHLEAAIIDQIAAGTFEDKAYAFVAVTTEDGPQLGVAVANERGYNPIPGKTFKSHAEAVEWADGLNEHIGLSRHDAAGIVISTMGGIPFAKQESDKWAT
jgi:hypothetical protein